MKKNELRKQTVRYIQITLGALIVCLGFNLFIIPAHLLTGGISGIALIIYYLTDLPVGMQNIVYNLPILYLAYKVFGRLYAWDTVVGTVVLSLILDATHFLVDWNITQDGMLNAIFGGVMAGIGFGIIFRANANTGGLDVVGAVVKKFYSVDMGTVIFLMNFIIVMSSAWMFNIDEALYTLVSIYVTAELTNRVAAGLNREKSIFIVSPAAEQICQDIMENVHRGVTFLEGKGGFAQEHKDILFIVVRLTQVSRVKAIVDHYDRQAFMIVSDTSEVSGKGFTLECESYQDARAKWQEEQKRHKELTGGHI
ncbi:YitT family protein [Selenomonas sp. AE3005]|uniref:YitT family protein n=1 Tax=Selenomonas sp. AE3005 TaxID=1485543 RepID=UPI0025EB7A02|nr:YitT family protein [Selenomonas sp. AE3005]